MVGEEDCWQTTRLPWLKFGGRKTSLSKLLSKYRGVTLVNCVLSQDTGQDSSQDADGPMTVLG
jgi:hypothetical protein